MDALFQKDAFLSSKIICFSLLNTTNNYYTKWLQESDFNFWNQEQFSIRCYLADGEGPRCGTGSVDPHKIKGNVQSQAVLRPVPSRGEALGPDKVSDRRVAGGPFPDTVHPHVCSRHPPDVTPLHLEEAELCPDKVKLDLSGNFSQGAPGLKLAEVVGGSPVGAGARVEEQAAHVHRVAVHPALRAASLLKVKSMI